MKQIFIETDYSSFEDFHDGKWFEHLFKVVDGLKIVDAIEHFSTHWWGASRAFVLPWLLVSAVYNASNSRGRVVGSKQALWNEYLETNAFKGALWKTAESSFCSIYYAYEELIVRLINVDRINTIRVTDRDFNKAVTQNFGENIAEKVWGNSFIALTKEIRNCLVHCGGKASPKLLKMRSLPKIDGNDILISATDVRVLHNYLKPRVMLLVEHYASQPAC